MTVKQVGGDHYAAPYQHWDWVVDTGLGYLEANATKYLSRWRVKGGKQDLQKALSYVQKLIEAREAGKPVLPAGKRTRQSMGFLTQFLEIKRESPMAHEDEVVIMMIDRWEQVGQLRDIETRIKEMIANAP